MSSLRGIAQALAGLESLLRRPGPGRWYVAGLIFLVGFAAQELVYAKVLRPEPSHATRNGVSAAIGLLEGHGISVADSEAEPLRTPGFDLESDLLALHDPGAARGAAHEPMPGVILVFAAVAKATGSLYLSSIVHLQTFLHALLAALLFLELRERHPLPALVGALGWALFLPQYRVTLSPGHDALTALLYLASALAMLRTLRTGGLGSLLLAALLSGAGLWMRSFFLLLPPIYGAILLIFSRHRWRDVVAFGLVIVASAMVLSEVRSPSSGTTHRVVRGGLWHNFFTGVGQFENSIGIEGNDHSVREMAERLSGQSFDFPNYQYDAEYNAVLEEAGRAYLGEHQLELVRNAFYRGGWLLFPALSPSGRLGSGAARAAVLAVGLPLSAAGILGFFLWIRREPALTLTLLAPFASLVPLCAYMVIAKIPTQVFFATLVLAAVPLEVWLSRQESGTTTREPASS